MSGGSRRTFHSVAKWMSAALACAVLSSGGTILASDDLQTVLVLHSYHKADWTDSLMEGVESVFGERNDVELRVEYMDTKTAYSPVYLERLSSSPATTTPFFLPLKIREVSSRERLSSSAESTATARTCWQTTPT